MADSAAFTTPRSSGPAKTKRRARAASSNASKRPARAAIAFEQGEPAELAEPVRDAGRESRAKDDGHSAGLFPDDDAQGHVQDEPHATGFDPRQGTLAGFEVPAEVLASLSGEMRAAVSEGEQGQQDQQDQQDQQGQQGQQSQAASEPLVSAPAESVLTPFGDSTPQPMQPTSGQSETSPPPDASAQRIARTAPNRSPNAATTRRQPAAQLAERAARLDLAADALSAAAFAEAMGAVHDALASERDEAVKRAGRMARMLSIAMVALIVLVLLGVAQTVLLLRLSREAAADRQRTESLLLDQQSKLTALAEATSAAVASARAPVNAAATALPTPQPAHLDAEPRAARAKPAHAHRSKDKTKASTATH
jgi:hypothetical protein